MKLQFLNSLPLDVISGGNIYNKTIIEGLRQQGIDIDYNKIPIHKAYDISIIDSFCMAEMDLNKVKKSNLIIALIHQIPELDNKLIDYYKTHTKFIVTGTPAKLELINLWQVNERNIHIIRPGIPNHWKSKTEFRNVPKRILIVANFIQNKGYEMLVKIIKRLNHLDLEFHIVGGDKLNKPYAKKIIKSLESTSSKIRFYFNLNRDEVHQQFLKSDIYLSLSKSETFGMSLFEALSLKLPCITFNTGDSEYFSAFRNYVAINNYSEDDFIKVIDQWVNNPDIYKPYCNVSSQNKRHWNQVISEFSEYLKNNLIAC